MKRLFVLFLVLAMLLSAFAGCGSTAASQADTASDPQTQESAAEEPEAASEPEAVGEASPAEEPAAASDAEEPAEEPSEEPAEEPETETEERSPVYTDVELPLVDEDVSLTLWYTTPPILFDYISDLSELYVYQELTKRTGVGIDFENISFFTAAEKFGLMLASGDYTDILVNSASNFSAYGGLDWAVSEDIIVPLTDRLDDAPVYKQAIQDSGREKDFYTDGGNLCGFYQIAANEPLVSTGYLIRQDMLDGVGAELPTTFDQLEDALTAIVDQYDVEMGIYINEYGGGPSQGLGIVVINEMGQPQFTQTDGKVRLGLYDDALKTYLEYMSRWYQKGIIYKDYISLRIGQFDPETKMMSGASACAVCDYDRIHIYKESSTEPDFRLTGMLTPVLNEGDVCQLAQEEAYVNTMMSWLITTGCTDEEIDAAIKLCNYFYTDEGSLLLNYGTEGYTFNYDENGKPVLSDLILHNPDGMAMNFALGIYVVQSGPMFKDFDRQYVDLYEGEEETLHYWTDNQTREGHLPSSLSLTVEESSRYSAIMSDVMIYANESINRFIMGELNLEEDYDNYLETMKSMGVEDAIAIYQAALDRYNER